VVCLFVYELDYEQILMKFFGRVTHGQIRMWLDFGGDLESFMDSASVQFSSVTIFCPRKSYNKVMTAALIRSSCVRTTQSLAGW